MRFLIYICLYSAFTTILCSCSSKAGPQVVHEAADYSPIGLAIKFIGLCFLGISVVTAAAILLKTLIK